MDHLFDAAGSLRELYSGVDWAATSLGPARSWSPVLRATLRMAWKTRFPVTLFWGPDRRLLYNEAYVPLIADKHPSALGAPARDVFPEIWDDIGPLLAAAARGGDGTWVEDLRLLMDRHGYPEETYFTFSYSAVTDPAGRVEGLIDIAAETTSQVLGNRRLQLLRRLGDELAGVEDRDQLVERALPVLRAAGDDVAAADLVESAEPMRVDGATVRLPLAGHDTTLVVRLSPYLPVDDPYLGFVRLIGGALTQALDRIQARRAERTLASMERAMSETLQSSLLSHTVRPGHLQVAVRYQSSIAQAHIGGDWYDSFLLPDGTLTVAVGDVSGHDRQAAAAMAQIRNLLRGIAFTVHHPPSLILTHLSAAMTGLPVDAFATVVLAQIEPDTRTLRWSNAGHPPPALLSPDGTVRLLQTKPETLLGPHIDAVRSDHTVTLEPGATVVLYTDGLIERRRDHLDDGLSHLARALTGRSGLDAEQLCDHLLDEFAAEAEDDIALTVIQIDRR